VALAVSLDIVNAFNSIPWDKIVTALEALRGSRLPRSAGSTRWRHAERKRTDRFVHFNSYLVEKVSEGT
jgi:hypothetical protein